MDRESPWGRCDQRLETGWTGIAGCHLLEIVSHIPQSATLQCVQRLAFGRGGDPISGQSVAFHLQENQEGLLLIP